MAQDFCPLKTKSACSISCQISSELKEHSPLHFSIFLIHNFYVSLIEYINCQIRSVYLGKKVVPW